jgi:hypothetical protein
MQTENCISCGIGLEPIENWTPCYDDGGGLDCFDVVVTFPENAICEGCYEHIPGDLYIPDSIESDDDIPF